jgi:hypothetical protein
VDADAYAAEMKEKQDACKTWLATTEEESEIHIRAEQAMATFIEANLTLKKQPTVDAIPVEWLRCLKEKLYGNSNGLAYRMLLDVILNMWQKKQEAR